MQDSRINMEDQVFEQALDSIQKEIDDMEQAEIAASQMGKGLGDYDLSAAAAKVRQARVSAEQQIAREQQAGVDQEQAMAMLTPEGRAAQADQIREQYPRQDEQRPDFVASATGGGTTENGDEEVPVEEKPKELQRMTREEYEKRGVIKDVTEEKFRKKMTPEEIQEQEEYEAALARVKEKQKILTPELLKDEKIKELYDKLYTLPVEQRQKYLENVPNIYLEEGVVKKLLGDDKSRQELQKDIGTVSQYMNKRFPGYYQVKGEIETGEDPLLYGIKSALLLQGDTGQTTEEARESAKQDIERKKGFKYKSRY